MKRMNDREKERMLGMRNGKSKRFEFDGKECC
jgi:hypothetical protein